MSKLQKGFDASVYIALQVAQLHPAVGIAMAAYNVASGSGSVWDALEFAGVAGKALSLIRRAEFVKDLLKARRIPCKCMVAGTLVLTPSGAVPIESLEGHDEPSGLLRQPIRPQPLERRGVLVGLHDDRVHVRRAHPGQ